MKACFSGLQLTGRGPPIMRVICFILSLPCQSHLETPLQTHAKQCLTPCLSTLWPSQVNHHALSRLYLSTALHSMGQLSGVIPSHFPAFLPCSFHIRLLVPCPTVVSFLPTLSSSNRSSSFKN